ncbi:hypothetical protein PTKU46_23370 [Paraburkholderia terrae]
MCASYEANPNDARRDVFSLFPRPEFEYRRELYKDYYAPRSFGAAAAPSRRSQPRSA